MRGSHRRAWTIALTAGLLASAPAAGQLHEPDPDRCSPEEPLFCLDGVGSAVTSLDSTRVSGTRLGAVGRESQEGESAQAALRGDGLSAGDTFAGFNVWASWLYSDFESDVSFAPYEARMHNWLVGVDRQLGDRVVLGVAAGVEDVETTTRFNGGGAETLGLTAAPYAVFIINDVLSLDASVGYTHLDTDQDRINTGRGGTTPGNVIRGDYAADRVFGTVNLGGVWVHERWVLGARVGLLHTAEVQDAYVETGAGFRSVAKRRIDLTQAHVGADVAYSFGAWEPYAIASYHHDISRDDGSSAGGLPANVPNPTPDDDDEIRAGLGLRYFGDGVSGALEWSNTLGRSKFDEQSVSLTVRFAL